VDALDVAGDKLDEARATAGRLGLQGATFAAADLTRPFDDPTPRYDRILLATFAGQQARMLAVVAPALRPGGVLTYAVCTFDRRECEDVVTEFLRTHPGFAIEPAAAAGGRVDWSRVAEPSGAVRTWPHRDGADAFFAVRLRRPG
jgi:16S rRNA (cytosine967-C5)-methyltransferase